MDEVGIGEFARRSRLSVKALRLYDELDVLVPARVDEGSGYRYYDPAQLDAARLIATMRQLGVPLADIKELLACDPAVAAQRVAKHWQRAEATHAAHRDLARYLIDRLNGTEQTLMYDVATREMPERTVLCLKRNVDEQGAWALGKEFMAILRERPLPRMDGRAGATFSIYWGEVSADSDGPVEWCRPIPSEQAAELAVRVPELSLRVEPAHREAFVALPAGTAGNPAPPGTPENPFSWHLASESLRAWADVNGINAKCLDRAPEDLGPRITYLAELPITATSVPDCDFAVPFA